MKQEKGIKRPGGLLEHRLGMCLSCARLKMGHSTGPDHCTFAHSHSVNIAELLKFIHRKENAMDLPNYGHR